MLSGEEEAEYRRLLGDWIARFHGTLGTLSEAKLDRMVEVYVSQENLYDEKIDWVFDRLDAVPARVLEVGSSTGGLAVAFAKRGITVDGVEPDEGAVAASRLRARRAGVDTARFHVGVGESLPFDDASFDLIASFAVLEHVADPPAVAREAHRVLRTGGVAVFEVPNNWFPFEGHYKIAFPPMAPRWLARAYLRARDRDPSFLDTLHYMSRGIVRRMFRAAGFRSVVDVYGEWVAGKATGARWSHTRERAPLPHWSGPVVGTILTAPMAAQALNRAVTVFAIK
ncbi:MAG: class I SAM-dependent methyltransferase [Alphaproteobacteria bacterium]|nr:class I SAM-dependent methyltransferase [Alphaproteobacteria bacterium]